MTQIKIIPQTKEQIKKLYELHGKSKKLLVSSGIESFMPEKVVFGQIFWQDMPETPQMGHFRVETFNAENMDEKGSVSVSRIHVLGVKKSSPDQVLTPENLVLRSIKSGELAGKKTYMINGKPLNPVMQLSEDDTILKLQGKTWKPIKAERFNVPYAVWESKQQAIDATAGIAEYYELSEVK